MPIQLEVRVIDGVSYEIAQFALERQQKNFHKLSRLVSPSLGPMISSFVDLFMNDNKGMDAAIESLNWEKLGGSVATLFTSINEDEAPQLTRDLCEGAHLQADKKPVNYDQHFQQKGLAHLYKVAFAVIEVNYKDFLSDIKDAIKENMASLPDLIAD